ncbi:MAG: patatin-like phospholipase family protein [Vicingaceae bacterium]|nr:patatin-like phospholipase family protein [Vicingaceae bacterium]
MSSNKIPLISMSKSLCLVLLLSITLVVNAQRVGLVFSGGGSSGIAHIGVLKALEENNIPIDFIAGTSMGGLVAGFYAAGYSPKEIEEIFLSDKFKNWANGQLDNKYVYYLRQKKEDPSLFTFKLNLDTIIEVSLPTNLVSPSAINYALMQYLAPASAKSKNNFDSLFIPFRCIASDIISKKPVVLKKGALPTAIRATMAYPFYLSPVTYEKQLLFDGGLYNNFPSNVMYNEFDPDFIIGSNVSSNFLPPNEDDIISQIKAIISNDTEYIIPCEESVLIEPDAADYSTFNFDNNEELIKIGYEATLKKIEYIKDKVSRRIDTTFIAEKRKNYIESLPKLIFDNVEVQGLKTFQNTYIKNSIRLKKDTLNAEDLKSEYIKVSSDDKIKSLYPEAIFNNETNKFNLLLNAKKEKNLFVSFGGVFSSRPINTGYLGLQYNVLRKKAYSFIANTYFGKLHNSVSVGFRIDFPKPLPFYWVTTFNNDRWDYFKSNSTFFEDTRPSFLRSSDLYAKTELGIPVAYKGKLVIGATTGELDNEYYQTRQFLSTDTTDETIFRNNVGFIKYQRNSLDKKQYATSGSFFTIGAKYIKGKEKTTPGSTSIIKDIAKENHEWFIIKATYDKYFLRKGIFRFGIFGEGVYSNQSFFENYTASILTATAFSPLSESRTLFQERLRTHSYAAGGIKNIITFTNNFHFRLEGYVFQPYQRIFQNELNKASYGLKWATREYIAAASLVYHTPIGPIAVNVNYYDRQEDHWSFLVHFGYLIFPKKSLH